MLPRLCQFGYGDELGLDCTGIPPLIQLEPSSSNSAKKVGKAVLLAPPATCVRVEVRARGQPTQEGDAAAISAHDAAEENEGPANRRADAAAGDRRVLARAWALDELAQASART